MTLSANLSIRSASVFVALVSAQSKVSGLVTLDGSPMLGGLEISSTIIFQPVGGGPKAVGSIDEDGYYYLYTGGKPGAVPGEYVVAVTVAEVIPASKEGMAPIPRNISPARYGSSKTSGFKFTVVPGKNTIDLNLESS